MKHKRNNETVPFIKYGIMCILFVIGPASCKKFVQIGPPVTEIAASTVFSNNTSAAAAMTGVYSRMISRNLADGTASIGFLQGMAADELKNYLTANAEFTQFYENAITSSVSGASNTLYWSELYNELYAANSVIAGLNSSVNVTTAEKQQLMGEAEFMRAFLLFYAVNLYGPVPIVTTTNYQANNTIVRSSVNQVYQQIIQDLLDAQTDLSDQFVDGSGLSSTERTRPNKGAASALLARVYLYYGNLTGDNSNYTNAATQASKVISNTSQYSLVSDLNSVFLANSNETIWQLQPVTQGFNTHDGYEFILTSAPGSNRFPVALNSNLENAFETGDNRFSDWVGSLTAGTNTYYYPFKYKIGVQNQPVSEYLMVLRLAEQYLIRAEAESNLGDQSSAVNDLNVIRNRAGLANYTGATDQASVQAAILHERQVELFTEWGHRWFDLKRTNNLNSVMGPPPGENVCAEKGGTWNPDWALLPLPLTETQLNPKLTQNPGY